jgi:glycerophosphoryl diester phosphodiesterase
VIDWLVRAPFAHRGLFGPDTGPENSLAAFAAAVARNYGIECDVRLLADGELVVFHDADTARLTGRRGSVAALRTGDLAGLRLGGTPECPPLLGQVLGLVGGRVPLYIELKPEPGRRAALVRGVLSRLAGYDGPCCLASFDPWCLALAARHAPGRVRCLIASDSTDVSGSGLGRLAHRLLFHALPARPHCIAYDIRALPNAAVGLARRLGLAVLLWTVGSREDMNNFLRHGDNIVFEGFLPPSPATWKERTARGESLPAQTKES